MSRPERSLASFLAAAHARRASPPHPPTPGGDRAGPTGARGADQLEAETRKVPRGALRRPDDRSRGSFVGNERAKRTLRARLGAETNSNLTTTEHDSVAGGIPITLGRRRPAPSEVGPPLPASRPLSAPAGFHVLAKPTGAICNLDCSYCFYLEKEELYAGDRFRMRSEVAKAYITQVIESHAGAREVTLAWQGGEPTLMGLPFFSSMVAFAESIVAKHQSLVHTLQTNGTLLNDDWATFLAEKRFLVGISIDGPEELHDTYRVDKKGRPTHHKVLAGLEHLRRHGVDYNVLCTVNAANAAHGRSVYRYLRDDCGAQFVQFIPIVEHTPTGQDHAAVSPHSVDPKAWGRFLIEVFEDWVSRDVGCGAERSRLEPIEHPHRR